jgi:uncharacterized membrane protein YeaQ/YmgE (transglycosylase-associated protein family)
LHWLYVILIGFFAGLIARVLSPAPNNPQGFILTTVLGIVGAVVANFLERALFHYPPWHQVGLIGSTIGAVIVLAIWHWMNRRSYY